MPLSATLTLTPFAWAGIGLIGTLAATAILAVVAAIGAGLVCDAIEQAQKEAGDGAPDFRPAATFAPARRSIEDIFMCPACRTTEPNECDCEGSRPADWVAVATTGGRR